MADKWDLEMGRANRARVKTGYLEMPNDHDDDDIKGRQTDTILYFLAFINFPVTPSTSRYPIFFYEIITFDLITGSVYKDA